MLGYGGRILFVDLSAATNQIESFDEGFARDYLGGNGFAAKLLYDHVRPRIDHFYTEDFLLFAVCPILDKTAAPMVATCPAAWPGTALNSAARL